MKKNDGVQFYQGTDQRCWYYVEDNNMFYPFAKEHNSNFPDSNFPDLWLPPLYPHRWQLWIGVFQQLPQVAICLAQPRASINVDIWNECVAKGSWKEMWPLFLTYVNLMNRGETE